MVAAPHATFRHLRKLMLSLWLDCGCGHLNGYSRLSPPAIDAWPKRQRRRRRFDPFEEDPYEAITVDKGQALGAALRVRGEVLLFGYDDTCVTIEVKHTAAPLSAGAAAWLGARKMAAALRNAHPGTVLRCAGCGEPGRYCGGGDAWCSKRCAAEAWGLEARRLRRLWNGPRDGAAGYCGPDGVTPDAFWPEEPGFGSCWDELGWERDAWQPPGDAAAAAAATEEAAEEVAEDAILWETDSEDNSEEEEERWQRFMQRRAQQRR